jgi:hypothetical protein
MVWFAALEHLDGDVDINSARKPVKESNKISAKTSLDCYEL